MWRTLLVGFKCIFESAVYDSYPNVSYMVHIVVAIVAMVHNLLSGSLMMFFEFEVAEL